MLAAGPGCDGGVGNTTGDGGTGYTESGLPLCPASQQSGLWLLPFGPLAPEINTGTSQTLTVIVTKSSTQQGQGSPMVGKVVTFKKITQTGDATLDKTSVPTDKDGLAAVTFKAGKKEGIYQVEASSAGTCPVTFSVDVRKPQVTLTIIAPKTSTFDTFTGARIPIVAQASQSTEKYGSTAIADAEITFTLTLGKTSETLLSPVAGGKGAATLKVKTNVTGRATAMLDTGSKVINQLKVTAALTGTADASVILRIVGVNLGKCKSDAECPLGYNCVKGKCEPPVTTPPSGCKSNADCTPPLICQVSTGKCLKGTGKTCDPIEGTGCAKDEVCIGNQCAKLPPTCKDNSDCPSGYICVNGTCVPQGKPPGKGCTSNSNCPPGQVCINGKCVPKSTCLIKHNPDRLKGNWKFDSLLHLRDALSPVLKGLLGTAGTLNSIISGTFSISGVPSIISSLVSKYLQSLIKSYVPPWGTQLVAALSNINDVCDDMRVLSTVKMTSTGTDSYVCAEVWDIVEFTFQGKKISSPPQAIPTIGKVKVPNYTGYEICGTLLLSKHSVTNQVGGIVKWAIDTSLSLITCGIKSVPCYNSVSQALSKSIDCQKLAMQLDKVIQGIWSGAPSVAGIVAQACLTQKNSLITTITNELNALATKLSLMEMTGTATIPLPGKDTVLTGGKWDGVLGSSIAKGNFNGEFTAKRAP